MTNPSQARPRTPFVGGNWKMNTTLATAVELAEAVSGEVADAVERVDVAVFPPFPYLQAVGHALGHRSVLLGAQDCSAEEPGAFTGQVAAAMLDDLGVQVVLVGHSERRHGLGESSQLIGRKLRMALDFGLIGMLAVGETLSEREGGRLREVVVGQLDAALAEIEAEDSRQLVIAYEPVWAIGTGRNATPAQAQEAHGLIRDTLRSRYDDRFADSLRILYGGSMTAANAADLLAQPDIDGGLVGGASLKPADFAAICRAAAVRAKGSAT
jgi:triosephosphate isomerase